MLSTAVAAQIYSAMVAAGELDAEQVRQLTTSVDAGPRVAGGQRRPRSEDDDADESVAVMILPDAGGDFALHAPADLEGRVSRC